MKKTFKKWALALALILIALVLAVACIFLGNPISYLLAFVNASNLIRTEYVESDYKIESIKFEMKHGDYVASIKSPTKVDEYFTLWMDGWGKIRENNYDWRVEQKVNTGARLSEEYSSFVAETGLWKELDSAYQYTEARIINYPSDYDGKAYIPHKDALTKEEIELNKVYDIKEFARVHGELVIQADLETPTYETIANILLQVKKVADEKNVPFYTISIHLREKGVYSSNPMVQVVHLLYDDIYETDLMARIKANAENYDKLKAEAGLGEPI